MEGHQQYAYTVRSENGHVLLAAEGNGTPPGLRSPAQLGDLEEAAAHILNSELGIEVDADVVHEFAHDVLEPRMPRAHVSADQLWAWIDR